MFVCDVFDLGDLHHSSKGHGRGEVLNIIVCLFDVTHFFSILLGSEYIISPREWLIIYPTRFLTPYVLRNSKLNTEIRNHTSQSSAVFWVCHMAPPFEHFCTSPATRSDAVCAGAVHAPLF